MAIFEFACMECDHSFEELVTGSSTVVCPECGGGDLEKLFSTFAASGGKAEGPIRYPEGGPTGGCGPCGCGPAGA